MFDTFYMPAGELPDTYGIAEARISDKLPRSARAPLYAVNPAPAAAPPLPAFCRHR